jgi:putative membrane protein
MGPGPGPWIRHGRHIHEGMGWGGWVLWILLTVAFWALVIMAVIWLVRSITGRGPANRRFIGGAGAGAYAGPPWATRYGPAPMMTAPEQILAERYARGEIDEPEYRTRLSVLRGDAMSPGGPGGPGNEGAAPPPEAPPPSA